MNIKLEIILLVTALIAIIAVAGWAFITEKRLKRFFLGKKAKDLEGTIESLEKDITDLKNRERNIERNIAILDSKMKKAVRGVETIRFNPFSDQGSNQSFAIGMLNEDGDGVVISSLYSRERMSIFAKPIKSNKSDFELSSEEKEVLKRAEVK